MSPTVPLKDEYLHCQKCYINGAWTSADDGRTLTVHNPASGEMLGTVPRMGVAETRRAIEAAGSASPVWSKRTPRERSVILRKWFELLVANQEDLAILLTAEQGKPLAEARAEISCAASFIEWFAEEGKRIHCDAIPSYEPGRRIVTMKDPIGVVAVITPWNEPAAMIARKAVPALAAGCPVVLMPAPATPFSALALAELGERAGIPSGVFNVITGPAGSISKEFTTNPIVQKVVFAGPALIGSQLMELCALSLKKLSLELESSSPFIVFDDADLNASVVGAIASGYHNTGQAFVGTNRFLVQEKVYAGFTERLAEAVAQLKVGHGLKGDTQLGPLIDTEVLRKLEARITDAVAKGGRVITGGKRHALEGTYFQPTVIANAAAAVAKEETVGPVALLFRFRTEEEAIHLANDFEPAHACCFYTRDPDRAWRAAERIKSGMVGINSGILSPEGVPFGGARVTGIDREGSRNGIEDYLTVKYVCMGGIA